MKVIWANIIVRVISANSLFLMYHIISENKTPIIAQNIIHHINIDENIHIHSKIV
jgi:hypothetical protein